MTRLLSTRDVAEMFGASEDWVRAHAGELGGVKLAGLLRFDERSLERVIDRHRLEPPPTPRRSSRPGPPRRGHHAFTLLPIPEETR